MMSIIVLTGILIYEGYRLWLWGLAPTLPILPPSVPVLDRIDNKTDYISDAITDPTVITFNTDTFYNNSGFTVSSDIYEYYQTTTPNELSTVQFVTNTNNLVTQAKDENTTATVAENDSHSRYPLPMKAEIESISDQSVNQSSSKLSDLLLLLRLYPNTTHNVNIYIKKKNKDYNSKPTAFDIIFNALNSKPQSLTSNLSHVMNSIKPSYSEIPKFYSTVNNVEATTVTDQYKETSRLASSITIPQTYRYERNDVKKLITTTALAITSNTANDDTLQIIQLLNESDKYTRGPRKLESGLSQDSNLIPYTNSQLKVHEIKVRMTTDKIETKSEENTYRLPTPLAYNKNSKLNLETKTTPTYLFKRVKRSNCRSKKLYAPIKLVGRKMRHSRLHYTKSYKTTEQKTTEQQTVNSTLESSTPSNIPYIVNKSERTTYSLITMPDIDDEVDEFSDETEVYTQFETDSTTSSLKTLDIKHEFNTPINNEEDESESVEETEKTPTLKNETDENVKRKFIEVTKNFDEITTMNDEDDEIESGEVTEVSSAIQDDSNKFIPNKIKRKTLKNLDAELDNDNIRENYNRKTRTSKPNFNAINSTKRTMNVTNYIEDESGSAETTSVSTTIADEPEETQAPGMDILFILKTRLAKPTVATTLFKSKDLLQILEPNSTIYLLDNDTSYLDSNIRN